VKPSQRRFLREDTGDLPELSVVREAIRPRVLTLREMPAGMPAASGSAADRRMSTI
jgi:hypothetical protein